MPDKMAIEAFKDTAFSQQVGTKYEVLINPAEYSHKLAIQYHNTNGQGANGNSPGFNKMGKETMSFTIWFDGTGVIPGLPQTQGSSSVAAQIQTFKDLVFRYEGAIHSPNYLQITWGTLLFRCRLVSLDLTYTMFQPTGEPIRAKCALSLASYTSQDELEKEAADQSPDMSHLVSVKAGDTLPLLCFQVYGTSVHYADVARVNGLSSFRHLTPGTQLLFPPLRTPTA
jgi:Contractile injection system tube protein